jgi:hypothetical protein
MSGMTIVLVHGNPETDAICVLLVDGMEIRFAARRCSKAFGRRSAKRPADPQPTVVRAPRITPSLGGFESPEKSG